MCKVLIQSETKDIVACDCPRCDGLGWLEDVTACGDPDHCSPMYPCSCNPNGLDV